MVSKLSLLMGTEPEGNVLPEQFSWEVMNDGRWDYKNDKYSGYGHFVTVLYSGAHGAAGPNDHSLNLGDAVMLRGGRAWRVFTGSALPLYDCMGVAMGWYEDSDGAIIQISGVIKHIGVEWTPGQRLYLPHYTFGKPEVATRIQPTSKAIGIALTPTDLLLIPQLSL